MLKIAYSAIYIHPLPEGHRFPMLKYELIPEQLIREGVATMDQFFEPKPCSEDVLKLTHKAHYIEELKSGSISPSHMRRIGFEWSEQLYLREKVIVQGTIDCAIYALKHGVALNIAGGTHHAFADRGEGFCLFNDMAVSAQYLLQHQVVRRILIVDLDVHQGNGTAAIFNGSNDVYTFSMHGAHNYPFHKEASDKDIGLEDGIQDDRYLELLKFNLDEVFDAFKPEFVFYLSGVDILSTDKFGKLAISKTGCMERDRLVFERCKQHNVPVAVAMGGGYSPAISDIVDAHVNTFKCAAEIFF